MATTTKKQNGVKETVKKAGQKVKSGAKKAASAVAETTKKAAGKVKRAANNYRADLKKAYDEGYTRGWDDAHKIPNRKGAATAAAVGVKHGIKDRRKTDKKLKKYEAATQKR